MAYDKTEMFNQAIEVIKARKLFFIEDIVAFMPCRKSTFYDLFPLDSDEMNEIKRLIDENKISVKVTIRSKLLKGKGMELIALYKLIGTNEERQRLSQQHMDHTTGGEQITPNIINLGVGVNPEDDPKK